LQLSRKEVLPVGEKNRLKIVIALLAVYVLWGATFLAMRIGLEGFPPFTLAGVRYLVTGLLMYLVLRLRGVPSPEPPQWKGAFIVGGLLLLGGNGCVVFAEQWVPSGLAALAIATVPLWTVLFSGIWGGRPSGREWAGLALGFVGVVLLNLDGGFRSNPAGAFALIFAAASWAFGSAWSRRLALPSGLMASAAEMIGGGVLLLITGFLTGERIVAMPGPRPIVALLYLMVCGSFVGFSAYVYLLGKVRPSLATSYAYVNPVVAVGLGIGLAGEKVSEKGFAAMAVIIAGVLMVIFGQKNR
jgi:drug/metabolite transporter (DMT)-like permease